MFLGCGYSKSQNTHGQVPLDKISGILSGGIVWILNFRHAKLVVQDSYIIYSPFVLKTPLVATMHILAVPIRYSKIFLLIIFGLLCCLSYPDMFLDVYPIMYIFNETHSLICLMYFCCLCCTDTGACVASTSTCARTVSSQDVKPKVTN